MPELITDPSLEEAGIRENPGNNPTAPSLEEAGKRSNPGNNLNSSTGTGHIRKPSLEEAGKRKNPGSNLTLQPTHEKGLAIPRKNCPGKGQTPSLGPHYDSSCGKTSPEEAGQRINPERNLNREVPQGQGLAIPANNCPGMGKTPSAYPTTACPDYHSQTERTSPEEAGKRINPGRNLTTKTSSEAGQEIPENNYPGKGKTLSLEPRGEQPAATDLPSSDSSTAAQVCTTERKTQEKNTDREKDGQKTTFPPVQIQPASRLPGDSAGCQ